MKLLSQLLIGVVIVVSSPYGCRDIDFTIQGYKQAVRSGLAQIPEARQFDDIFGKDNVDHFISYSGSLKVGNRWTSEVHFGGRYSLTMQVPVRMGRSFDKVLEVLGEPKFYILEIQKIEVTQNGQLSASYSHDIDAPYPFGVEDWKKIYEANGDLSVVGITLKTGPPIEHFDEYVAAGRRPVIQVER